MKHLKGESGSAMVYTMLAVALIFVGVSLALIMVSTGRMQAHTADVTVQTQMMADAGADYYEHYITTDLDAEFIPTHAFDEQSGYEIETIDSAAGDAVVTITGYYGDDTYTEEYIFTTDDE